MGLLIVFLTSSLRKCSSFYCLDFMFLYVNLPWEMKHLSPF